MTESIHHPLDPLDPTEVEATASLIKKERGAPSTLGGGRLPAAVARNAGRPGPPAADGGQTPTCASSWHSLQGFRYLDATLAAYVGEDVVIRYDPRDMAEIRVYYRNTFLCRAVCQDLAGHTVSLQAIVHARNHRRHQLRQTIRDRAAIVETLLQVHQPDAGMPPAPAAPTPGDRPRLKRY